MDVKPGYKQTEVGPLPEDWEVRPVGEIARFSSGRGISVSRLHDYSTDYAVPVFGGNGIAGYTTTAIALKRTVVIGRVGQRCGEVYLTNGPAWVSDNALYPVKMLRDCDVRFFALALHASALNNVKNRNDLPLITQSILHAAKLAWPVDPVEQSAIASTLSDVDALLDGLERLITKKRDLRLAAMQQLLTGQTRLLGFSGEWEVKQLGEHVTFLHNGVNSRAELQPEGRVRYLHYGDVHACKDAYMSPQALPCLPDFKAASLDRLRDGDLVLADASEDLVGITKSVEMWSIAATEVVPGLHTIAARFDKNVLADGFKGLLQFCPPFTSHLRRLAAGTKVYATNRAHIASVEMRLPTVAEQTAIAAVLSDMGAEIAAFEQRRDKTLALRQAIMQELLTGRTRLMKLVHA